MSFRSVLLRAVTVAGLAASVLVVAPAQAAATVTTDTSRPGHVVATVATDAAYVLSWLEQGAVELSEPAVQPVSNGTVIVDHETWGLVAPVLAVAECGSAEPSSCAEPSRAGFTPSDVRPEVRWSEDPVIRDGETFSITVSDPQGGGSLAVRTDCQGFNYWLDRAGTSTPRFHGCADGEHRLDILRCHPVQHHVCTRTGDLHTVRFNQVFEVRVESLSSHLLSPAEGPDLTALVSVTDPAPAYQVRWGLFDDDRRLVLVRDLTDVEPDPSGRLSVPIDVEDTPTGEYSVSVGVTYLEADGGEMLAGAAGPTFGIDRDAPVVQKYEAVRDTFYPDKGDHYQNDVRIDVRVRDASDLSIVTEVRDTNGAVVRTLRRGLVWDGRDKLGEMVPEGEYALITTFVDAAGHSTQASDTVRVSHARVVSRTLVRDVTATASLVDHWAGRCSRVRTAPPGRAAGTLGLHSDVACEGRTWERSGVVSVHATRMPRALFLDRFEVRTLGGAAASMAGSRASVQYWRPRGERWSQSNLIGPGFTLHDGYETNPRKLSHGDDLVAWRVVTGYGARYDVQSFRVRVKYRLLV